MAVIKRFKRLLRFVDGRYCWQIESGLNRPEMALNVIVVVLHVIDIQYYMVNGDDCGIVVVNCKNL